MAEFTTGEEKRHFHSQYLESFDNVQEIISQVYAPTNPVRLGMSLSIATMKYDLLDQPAEVCNLNNDKRKRTRKRKEKERNEMK